MKTKKTIAAIAALMIAVSSVSSLPFAVSANVEDIPAAEESANIETAEEAVESVQTVPETTDNTAVDPLEDTGVAVQTETATVLTAAEYEALTDEQKAEYTLINSPDMFVTYTKQGESVGTGIPSGSYVKRGTDLWFYIPAEDFYGNYVYLLHDDTVDAYTDVVYLTNNIYDWGYSYTVKATDNAVTAVSVANNAPAVLTSSEYATYIEGMKSYYTKVNVQSPAYVLSSSIPNQGIYVNNGDYVLKNLTLWIAALSTDYIGHDIYLNGEKFNVELQPDYGNAGAAYTVQTTDTELNITVQERPLDDTDRNLRIIKVGNTVNAVPEDFIDLGIISVTNGEATYRYISNNIDKNYVVDISGEENIIVFGIPRNLAYGSDILVNGVESYPMESNTYPALWQYAFTVEDNGRDIVISQVESDTLDKFNDEFAFAEVNIDSGISVREYPFGYDPNVSGDNQYALGFRNHTYIASGTELVITVNASNYAGKVLKINGQTVNMQISTDGSCYGCNYVVNGTSPITMSLETEYVAPVVPSRPSAPSSNPEASAPAAPSTPAPSVNTPVPSANSADAPTAQSVAKDMKKSGKSSVSYDASEAGVTEDILTAFANNKYAKTMTAKFEKFKVKINKSDIEDIKALEDIDFSVNEKDFISKSQIKKTNALKNSQKIVQLNFESSEDISGLKKVNIQAKAGKSFNGSTAVVYEFKGKKLVKVGTAKVDLNGYVAFDTDHLGQFVVAVK